MELLVSRDIGRRVRKRGITRNHCHIARASVCTASTVTPFEATQRLGHRHPRVAIFIAAEQEPSVTLTAKRMRSDAL